MYYVIGIINFLFKNGLLKLQLESTKTERIVSTKKKFYLLQKIILIAEENNFFLKQ